MGDDDEDLGLFSHQFWAILLLEKAKCRKLPAFMMKRFPANEAMVTADNPVLIGTTQGFGLPRAALVGVDGKVLADGLCMPHSPRWYQDRLYFLSSGAGHLMSVVPGAAPELVAELPGLTAIIWCPLPPPPA